MRCFEQLQPPAAATNGTDSKETVYSDVPEEAEEAAGRIAWFRGIRQDMGRERLSRQKAVAVSTGDSSVPSTCSAACSGREHETRHLVCISPVVEPS